MWETEVLRSRGVSNASNEVKPMAVEWQKSFSTLVEVGLSAGSPIHVQIRGTRYPQECADRYHYANESDHPSKPMVELIVYQRNGGGGVQK